MFHKSEIREEIRRKPCPQCDRPVSDEETGVLTFLRGEFVQLHEACMIRAQEAVRAAIRAERG